MGFYVDNWWWWELRSIFCDFSSWSIIINNYFFFFEVRWLIFYKITDDFNNLSYYLIIY
jgi:hypothetical protein